MKLKIARLVKAGKSDTEIKKIMGFESDKLDAWSNTVLDEVKETLKKEYGWDETRLDENKEFIEIETLNGIIKAFENNEDNPYRTIAESVNKVKGYLGVPVSDKQSIPQNILKQFFLTRFLIESTQGVKVSETQGDDSLYFTIHNWNELDLDKKSEILQAIKGCKFADFAENEGKVSLNLEKISAEQQIPLDQQMSTMITNNDPEYKYFLECIEHTLPELREILSKETDPMKMKVLKETIGESEARGIEGKLITWQSMRRRLMSKGHHERKLLDRSKGDWYAEDIELAGLYLGTKNLGFDVSKVKSEKDLKQILQSHAESDEMYDGFWEEIHSYNGIDGTLQDKKERIARYPDLMKEAPWIFEPIKSDVNANDATEKEQYFETGIELIEDSITIDSNAELAKAYCENWNIQNEVNSVDKVKIGEILKEENDLLKQALADGYKYCGYEANDNGRYWEISKDKVKWKKYFILDTKDLIHPKIKGKIKANFITDNGEEVKVLNEDGSLHTTLARYAAWTKSGKGKYEVKELSNDLEMLKKKYNTTTVENVKDLHARISIMVRAGCSNKAIIDYEILAKHKRWNCELWIGDEVKITPQQFKTEDDKEFQKLQKLLENNDYIGIITNIKKDDDLYIYIVKIGNKDGFKFDKEELTRASTQAGVKGATEYDDAFKREFYSKVDSISQELRSQDGGVDEEGADDHVFDQMNDSNYIGKIKFTKEEIAYDQKAGINTLHKEIRKYRDGYYDEDKKAPIGDKDITWFRGEGPQWHEHAGYDGTIEVNGSAARQKQIGGLLKRFLSKYGEVREHNFGGWDNYQIMFFIGDGENYEADKKKYDAFAAQAKEKYPSLDFTDKSTKISFAPIEIEIRRYNDTRRPYNITIDSRGPKALYTLQSLRRQIDIPKINDHGENSIDIHEGGNHAYMNINIGYGKNFHSLIKKDKKADFSEEYNFEDVTYNIINKIKKLYPEVVISDPDKNKKPQKNKSKRINYDED